MADFGERFGGEDRGPLGGGEGLEGVVFLDDDVVEELVLDHVVAGGVARGKRAREGRKG